MVREEAISVVLGYTSIACWLGAQLPQIVVNWRRKSVDGLALPFLANWFLGDATNLLGCLLTNQLPFQTYLATYFVFVDICLLTQYIRYDAPRHAKALSTLASPSARQSRTSLLLPSPHSPLAHTLPRSKLSRSRSRSYSIDPHLRATVANMALATSEFDAMRHDPHGLEVDVHGSQARWRSRGSQRAGSLEGLPESVVADPRERQWGGRRVASPGHETGDEAVDAESESTPSIMVDSFLSEGGGGRGRGKGKHVSWSRDSTSRDRSRRRLSQELLSHDRGPSSTEPSSTAASTVRGRQLTRPTAYDSPVEAEAPSAPSDTLPRSRRTSAASTVSAAASRRSAGIIFLSVFALFGLSSRAGYRMRRDVQGAVLSVPPSVDVPVTVTGDISPPANFASPSPLLTFTSAQESVIYLASDARTFASSGDTQRVIGRVSAWTCTTLYLTSRLPQIWKNFTRKSVEGLSMFLFVFAFLGNFFYVMSILTSPKMDLPVPLARQFLRDSVPYLLGSGGTLLFDITIVMQSFVYAPGRRGHDLRSRGRRKSLVGAGGEEETGLLAEDNEEAR